MAITLTGKKKSQKNLVLVFLISMVVLFIILYYQFFSEEEVLPVENEPYRTIKKINLDFGVLDNPLISKLEPFSDEPATPSQEEVGRDNPFYPYQTSSEELK